MDPEDLIEGFVELNTYTVVTPIETQSYIGPGSTSQRSVNYQDLTV